MAERPDKSLINLFSRIPVETISEIPDIKINGVAWDSRKVQPGNIFIAMGGEQTDGFKYIPQAVSNGAVAILGEREGIISEVPYIQIKEDTKFAMATLAAALYDFPARKLTVIGVTGTDGKTTTTNMIYQILTRAGIKAGMISTVNAVIGDEALDTGYHVTTPESPEIQAYLARMVASGLTHVVLETTSHGLKQGRVIACDYDLAVITNVTHEHLDFHGSYQAYLEAKGMLFEELDRTPQKPHGNLRTAILNKDDNSYGYLKRVSPMDQISYSMMHEATIWA
ncbi:MAG: Mur ligase family protein, partial [Anaerolineaceae bacterium]|nr:Mur ligase family protein [Anaerolineaceae bacterium]